MCGGAAVAERLDMLSEEVVAHAGVRRGREDFRAAAEDAGLGMFGGKQLGILGNGSRMGGRHERRNEALHSGLHRTEKGGYEIEN